MEIINVITEQDDSDSDIEENDKKRFERRIQDSQNKIAHAKAKNSQYEVGHIEGTSDPVLTYLQLYQESYLRFKKTYGTRNIKFYILSFL